MNHKELVGNIVGLAEALFHLGRQKAAASGYDLHIMFRKKMYKTVV